jgi:methyl coenzyme M reductase subunit D
MYIATSFLYFTTLSCTSCTLSPLFYVSLHTELYFMYIVTSFLMFHYTQRGDNVHEVQLCKEILKRGHHVHEVHLCVVKHKKEVTMYMKYSSVCSEIWQRGENVHKVQLCVMKYKKEVTMYMKYSSVLWNIKKRWQCTWRLLVYISLHRAVLHAHCHLFFIFHYRVVLHVLCHLFGMLHYTELYFMYIGTSCLCFTTHSCSSE